MIYICDDIVYRPTVYKEERVYEIVSSHEDGGKAKAEGPLRLTSPMMRGEAVRELQETLVHFGYDVGEVDSVFGRRTEQSLREFQKDNGLADDGVLNDETAAALGL